MDNRLCNYKFVAGLKKGQQCNRFCRSGRNMCYTHFNQSKPKNKNVPNIIPNNDQNSEQNLINTKINNIPNIIPNIIPNNEINSEKPQIKKNLIISKPIRQNKQYKQSVKELPLNVQPIVQSKIPNEEETKIFIFIIIVI